MFVCGRQKEHGKKRAGLALATGESWRARKVGLGEASRSAHGQNQKHTGKIKRGAHARRAVVKRGSREGENRQAGQSRTQAGKRVAAAGGRKMARPLCRDT